MISSTSPSDRSLRSESVSAPGPVSARPAAPLQDRISTESAAFLRAELRRQPEIRPEIVARGRVLAADPDYPSSAVIRSVASRILASPDLSEDAS